MRLPAPVHALARSVWRHPLMPETVRSGVRLHLMPGIQRAMGMTPARAHAMVPGGCRICGNGLAEYAFNGVRQFSAYGALFAQVFACAACGHKQFLPDLNDALLADVYSQGYWATESEPDVFAAYYRADSYHVAEDVLETLAGLGVTPPYRLHEFGCGTGLTVSHLNRRGVDATGSDWSPIAIGFGKAQGNTRIFQENANTMEEMRGQRLDVVFTNHVLEHMPDPVGFLRSLAPVLHPGSLVIMRTPNGDGALNRRLGMLYDPLFYFPHHVHYFSPRSLALTGRNAGMKTLDLRATRRATGDLLNAAHGLPPDAAGWDERVAAAAEAYETEELQVVYAPADSAREPTAAPARAEARLPEPAPVGRRPRWLNVEDFYDRPDVWRYCFQRAGDTDLRGAMAYDPRSNLYYNEGVAIGDHFLEASAGGPLPALCFRAPADGAYRVSIEAAARFIGGPAIGLVTDRIGGPVLLDTLLSSPAPERFAFTAELAAGDRLRFLARAPETGMQRAICVIGIDA